MFQINNIITNLLELKIALKNENLLKVFTFLDIEITPNKKGFALANNAQYLIFKNDKSEIECLDLSALNSSYKINGYDLVINNLDLTSAGSLQDIFNGIRDSQINLDEELLLASEKKTVLNKYFGIKKPLKKKEMHQLIEKPIFINKDNTLSVALYDPNQKEMVDMVRFDLINVKTSTNTPYASLKYKLHNIPVTQNLNILFHPKYLITAKAPEFIEQPYILLNNHITQSEIDKILYGEITTDKTLLSQLKINLVTGPKDNLIGTIQILHYLLNSIIDYIHFNLEVRESYVNVLMSWKIDDGMNRETRLALSNSLKTEIHTSIFNTYYQEILANSSYSESIDLLMDKKHRIEKRQSYVNKKKDLVLYRISINSISLLEYCRYIIKVFKLENITIQNRLKL